MPGMPEISYVVKKDCIEIKVPLTSQGKFRCKTRDNFQDYGDGFAPKSTIIPKNAYVEWQIGYDMKTADDKKHTELNSYTFIGANKSVKHPYELSEFIFHLCKIGLLTKDDISNLISTINGMNDFLQESFQIQTEIEDKIQINDEEFFKSVISLPTFNKVNDSCGVISEITIQKQQYATGVQPMLYMIIPMLEFENANDIIGHTSAETKYGILKIDKSKTDIITNMFTCFGMCSQAHHHDIIEILKIVLNNAF